MEYEPRVVENHLHGLTEPSFIPVGTRKRVAMMCMHCNQVIGYYEAHEQRFLEREEYAISREQQANAG